MVCWVSLVQRGTDLIEKFGLDFFYILKTLVNIFEVTKKSDSVEFLSPG